MGFVFLKKLKWFALSRGPVLVDGRWRLQVDQLPIAFDDARSNLGRGLPLLVLLMGVIEFLQAGGAARAVRGFEAAVQAVVAHAVAIAVARLLVQHRRNL